ncbi:15995_t:CDS:2, partial [Gigaspora rosea]
SLQTTVFEASNNKENEVVYEQEMLLECEHERKKRKIATETQEEREIHFARASETEERRKKKEKFSVDNNMDPGEVPQELKGLTNVEKMLIAQVFPIISVFNLRGGQYAYHRNIINFPQDLQEFVTRLPSNPSTLDFLIVWRYNTNGSNFRDFNVRRKKIIQALQLLKTNNIFYRDIIVDNEILQSLPENGSIVEQLPQLIDENNEYEEQNEQNVNQDSELIENKFISQTFVPSLPPEQNEDSIIAETLNRMQQSHSHYDDIIINWPNHDGNSTRYIAKAFSTLFPTDFENFVQQAI